MARPEWVTYSDEEIEEMILKFNKEGKVPVKSVLF